MKQYKHKVARSKLEKAHLSEKQIKKVYSFKSKAKQEKAFQSIAKGVKLVRYNRFLKSNLALHILEKKFNKIYKYSQTEEYKKLSKKKQEALAKKQWKIEDTILKVRIRIAKTIQHKQDLIAARQERLDNLRAKINAHERAYYINRSTEKSYSYNNSINVSMEEFLMNHYPTEYQQMVDKGELSQNEMIESLKELAIADGTLKPLQQGVGYGYIDESTKEIISPV